MMTIRGLNAGYGGLDALVDVSMDVEAGQLITVAGPNGAGLARALSDPRVVVLGTLSKSFGAAGGFVAGPARLIELLVNTARTFIFDTALPPAVCAAAVDSSAWRSRIVAVVHASALHSTTRIS